VKAPRNPNGPYGAANAVQVPSMAVSKIAMWRDETLLSYGSGFFTSDSENYFLVTALHNLTGRNYFTTKCLNKNLATPNRIECTAYIESRTDEFDRFLFKIPLFEGNNPLFFYDWTETGADIAIMKIPKLENSKRIVCLNDATLGNWACYAGLDVTALGFPSALDISGTPVWKRVSIASEPGRKVDGKEIVLIDGLTFSGMSGGPVIISQNLGFTMDKVMMASNELKISLLGVYAGRYSVDKEKSGLIGYYWPSSFIDSIISEDKQIGDIEPP
jgi:hypothetical protein